MSLPHVACVVAAFLAAAAIIFWQADSTLAEVGGTTAVAAARYPFVSRYVEVEEGDTFSLLMERAGISSAEAQAILDAAAGVYDLSSVRLGRQVELAFDRDSGILRRLTYQIDTEEVLQVSRDADVWTARKSAIPYRVVVRTVEGEVESSLYAAGLKQDLDERAIIALADVFQWEIDFVLDVRQGDRFKFVFEERYLGGEYVMPGKVLAAKYINDGQAHYAFDFTDSSGKEGYYDEKGDSVERQFLKTPASFRYISSGFTTGQRYVSAFNVSTGHRAVDYAAPIGTPVRTVGDGTVVFAGWGGAYGNKVTVRHNSVYSTNYCHFSKILVKVGQRVSQGQTIGKVGSTGFSTGPHLHYEMVKNGTKINPLQEKFPAVSPVPAADKQKYLDAIGVYLNGAGAL